MYLYIILSGMCRIRVYMGHMQNLQMHHHLYCNNNRQPRLPCRPQCVCCAQCVCVCGCVVFQSRDIQAPYDFHWKFAILVGDNDVDCYFFLSTSLHEFLSIHSIGCCCLASCSFSIFFLLFPLCFRIKSLLWVARKTNGCTWYTHWISYYTKALPSSHPYSAK